MNATADSYFVAARKEPIGDSNYKTLVISLTVATQSLTKASVAGAVLTCTGSGFPISLPDPMFSFVLTTNGVVLPLEVLSLTPTSISINIPPGVNNQVFTLGGNGPDASGNKFSKNVTISTNNTPTVNVLSPLPLTPGEVTVVLDRVVLPSFAPVSIVLVSTINAMDTVNVSSWNNDGTKINFTVTLNSGNYKVMMLDPLYGYAQMNSTLKVTSAENINVSPVTVSYNGGYIEVQGQYISPSAYISLIGFRGALISHNSTGARFQVPAIVTPSTQSRFMLAKVMKLPLNTFTMFSDTASPTLAYVLDNSFTTGYVSTSQSCYIGFATPASTKASLNRFKFFSNPSWSIVTNVIMGASFEASNDNRTWVVLGEVDHTARSGWNSVFSNSTESYSFFRFKHTSSSKCTITSL